MSIYRVITGLYEIVFLKGVFYMISVEYRLVLSLWSELDSQMSLALAVHLDLSLSSSARLSNICL